MSNVFTSIPNEKRDLNVNTYDWSHEFNMSTKLGMITPIFVNKVPAHTSFSIDPEFAFQFMPMVFPIQTTIVARLSFYKMPIRALWKNYQDWISSVNMPHHSSYVPPFISIPNGMTEDEFHKVFGNGSLCDYFGIPSTFDGMTSTIVSVATEYDYNLASSSSLYPRVGDLVTIHSTGDFENLGFKFISPRFRVDKTFETSSIDSISLHIELGPGYSLSSDKLYCSLATSSNPSYGNLSVTEITRLNIDSFTHVPGVDGSGYLDLIIKPVADQPNITLQEDSTFRLLINGVLFDNTFVLNGYSGFISAGSTVGNFSIETCPWYKDGTQSGLKLSSYAHRMYDSIYNTFIRYIRNNPLYDFNTNIPLYNKVNQLYDHQDGVSDFAFGGDNQFSREQFMEFATPRFSNWEFDQFTTAVPSPQEGVAPLVGITTYANTVKLDDGTERTSLDMMLTDEDGINYKVDLDTDEEGINSVSYTQVDQVDGVPVTSLYQAVQQGISVLDIRNVNSYTRYLEFNQRKGYRYKDIIEGRFDVKVRFDELLMPEFIGGFTRKVRVSPVTQTVQTVESGTTYDGALGSKAGDAFAYGKGESNIRCYCDEESIIMGIISFTPKPVYTQTLPKWFLDRDVLDSFNPEFNNLGFQPLSNAEVAPIQFYNNDRDKLTAAFGYQRPWYHLLSMYDTAHGDFRGPLRNFLMHRVFNGVPKLSKSFLIVDPDQVNDVFNVNEDTDKIFGQVIYKCSVKLGVSRDAVPRLE